jgi:Flp pilus assembly protein TadD
MAATFLIAVFSIAGLAGETAVRNSRNAAKQAEDEAFAAGVRSAIKLGRQGNLEVAREHLEALVAKRPDHTDARFNLAVALVQLGKTDEASAQFEKVISLDPKDFDAVVELAALRVKAGKLEEALTLLESVPLGEGGLAAGALRQTRWDALASEERMKKLVAKHKGVDE